MRKTFLHHIGLAVVLLVALLASGLAAAPQAQAQTIECDALVVDDAGLFGDQLAGVEGQAKILADLGADVRVRTVQSHDFGNIDAYVDSLKANCPSWQSADGGFKNNLIVFVVAVDSRETALFFGERWAFMEREAQDIRVQTDLMNPRFAEGDFAGGFMAGIGEVAHLVDRYLHPQATPEPPVEEPAAPPVTTAAPEPPAVPTGPSPLLLILGGVLALALLGALAYGAFRLVRMLLLKRRARQAQQERAASAQRQLADKVIGADDLVDSLKLSLGSLIGRERSHPLAKTLKTQLDAAEEAYEQATTAYSRAQRKYSDWDKERQDTETYSAIADDFEAVLGQFAEADAQVTVLKGRIDTLQESAESLSALVATAGATLQALQQEAEAFQGKGFFTKSVDPLLSSLTTLVRDVDTAKSTGEQFSAITLLRGADGETPTAALDAAVAAVRNEMSRVVERKATLDAAQESFTKRLSVDETLHRDAVAAFDRIDDQFVEASWEAVAGNGSRAEMHLDEVQTGLAELTHLISMEEQLWDEAEDVVVEITEDLDTAETLLNAILMLEQRLETAKRTAQSEIDAARADIEKARTFINRYDDDIAEELEDELQRAQQRLTVATSELGKTRPNYLVVVEEALAANSAADRILDEAEEQHEAMERLRARALSARREAESSVQQARSYISGHRSDVASGPESNIMSAAAALATAASVRDLQRSISAYDAIKRDADNAYSAARTDVRQAQAARDRAAREAREAARRARQAAMRSSTSLSSSSRSFGSSSRMSGSSMRGSSTKW